MTFSIYKGGRLPPHPEDTHPRVYIDDFFDRGILMRWFSQATATELTVDWRGNIPTDGWGMDANGPDPTAPEVIRDTGVGDCGPAGMDHWQMAINAGQGREWASWGSPFVVSLYETLGGYKLGDPSTDNGTNLQDNLGFWRKNPINGIQLTGFGAIRPGTWDRATRVATMRMFGPLYTGVNLQNAQETQFPGPWLWVPNGSIAGGHCIAQTAELTGTDEIEDASWGASVAANTAFQFDAAEEMWALLTAESVEANGDNPYGFDMAQLNEAIGAMTGETNPLGLRKVL
jgi:hypothetical protein